ncbi:hypothetical protein [Streptacidiphilus sp. MAP5-3]|uniref:hypothetical protein n=1 Tax=unclassified Streptacidiphilus TaxID=2643834 RepID=UPI003517D54D
MDMGPSSSAPSAELHRARELRLAATAEEGPTRLAHICLDAWHGGDVVAAGMTLASLLRALPGVGPVTAHDILIGARATEATLLGALDHDQRAALASSLARIPTAGGSA